MLSVVILLATMNTLKKEADTLERLAACGMAEHLHGEECYDSEGTLICGMAEHVHTDACFQQRPVPENVQALEAVPSEVGDQELSAVPEAEVVSQAIEAPAEEITLELGELENDPAMEVAEPSSEDSDPQAETENEEPSFSLKDREFALASEIASVNSIDIALVSDVGAVLNDDAVSCVGVEAINGDWVVYPTRDFEEAELAFFIDEGIGIVKLTDGHPIAAQNTEEDAEENTEEDAGDVEASEPAEDANTEDAQEDSEPERPETTEDADDIRADGEDEEEAVIQVDEEAEEIDAGQETEQEIEKTEEAVTDGEETDGEIGAEDESGETDSEEAGEKTDEEADEEADATDAETDEEAVEESDATDAETDGEAVEEAEAPVDDLNGSDDESTNTAVTVDLADVETYPLSLRAVMTVFEAKTDAVEEPEQAAEEGEEASEEIAEPEQTTEGASEEIAEPEQTTEGASEEIVEPEQEISGQESAETPATIPTPAEAMALSVEYDDALLSIEATEDDRLITPAASFDSTDIVVGGIYVITLRNGSAEAAGEVPEIPHPAQRFEDSTDYVTVTVEADEGAFPEGTTMRLADVEDEGMLSDIGDAAAQNDFIEVQRVHAVDITFLDTDGSEIEPLIPISVVMTVRELEGDEETVVVHMDDAGNAELVEDAEPGEAAEDVTFSADAFSVYAVVVTKKLETRYITVEGETYNITVSYGPEAEIPAGAALDVREIGDDEAEAYRMNAEEALDQYKIITNARFFDISIMDGENAVQPAVPVTVQVTLAEDAEADASPCAVHFADDQTEVLDAAEAGETVVFRADGFSVWGVVYTVDFHYAVNGQTYDYSIPGGDCASLRALLPRLNVATDDPETEDDEVEDFLSGIESVEFSNPELVKVAPVEQDTTVGELRSDLGLESDYSEALSDEARALTAPDWALFSLKPFDTDETLTVTLKNGDTFAIAVTDAQIATRVLAADGLTYKITLTFGPEAGIPLDAELVAREINMNTLEWARYYLGARQALGVIGNYDSVGGRFFDIEITKDGEKIEPEAPVQVTIAYDDAVDVPEDGGLYVVHFAEDGTEVISDLTLDETGTRISYQQESFSVSGTIVEGPQGAWYGNQKNMVLVKYNGEDYIVLNDGTLEKLAKVNGSTVGSTVEADYPMFWRYDGSNIYHNYAAVGYGGLQLASAFYYRYLDANEPDALSEDTVDNTITVHETQYDVYDQAVDAILLYDDSRLQKPLAQIVYDEGSHALHSQSHPEWYIGVAEENGKLKLVGQQSSANAADIRFATVTQSDSLGTHGTEYNSVNHIDISVQGTATVKVPLDYGTYYFKDKGGNTRTLVVNRDNPVNVTLSKNVTVTPDDIRHASVTAYVEGENGKHEYKDNLFVISGYSQNAATEGMSTAQVRIEGVFKVADLSKVPVSELGVLTTYQHYDQVPKFSENGVEYANLDRVINLKDDQREWDAEKSEWKTTYTFDHGNNDPIIRKLRLANQVHYTVSTCKEETFPLLFNGHQLYASEADLNNNANPLDTDAMVTLASSFTYWDIKNECPILNWDVNKNNNNQGYWFQYRDAWIAGDIVLSDSWLNDGGSGMDFSLGDVSTIKDGTLAMQVTKYIVDKLGNRIYTWDETENYITVYEKRAQDAGKPNPDANDVRGLHVDAYDTGKAGQPSLDGYHELHDKKITVGTDGMGTIYDFDVDPGMIYVREHTGSGELLQEIVDTNGKTWTYTETHLETEYVWRGDGIEGRNHFSKTYTDRGEAYNSIPEVLGYYNDVTGGTNHNGYLSFVIYNVYKPGTTQVKVKKSWTHENGTAAEPPAGAEVTATIGRYSLVEDLENPATGTLTISQARTGASISNQDFHAVYRIKDGDAVIRTISYNPNTPEMVVRGLPFGTYTVETESYVRDHETVDPQPETITLSKANPTSTCAFSTQVKERLENKARVKLAVKLKGSGANPVIYREVEAYFDRGSKVIANFTRPGWRHSFSMEVWINGDPQTYEKPADAPEDFPRINDAIEFTIPENWDLTKEYSVTIYQNWGKDDVIFGEVYQEEDTGSAAGTNSAGGRNYAPLSTRRNILAAQNPSAGIPDGTKDPEPPVPGRKYVDDTAFSKTVTLKGAPWEEILAGLESVNAEGYPYLYYIKAVSETGVTEGTVPAIVLDGDHVLGSTGDKDLTITNSVPNEPPKLHVKKLDGQGKPLTGATFNLFYQAAGTEAEEAVGSFTISATDGMYTTGGLEMGSYRLVEASAPTGFIALSEAITFTVDNDYKIVTTHTPKGVSFDVDTYTLEVVNKPAVNDGEIAVMKRWQNLDGTETEADKESISITLRRTKVTPKSKTVKVQVRDPYTGIQAKIERVVNTDSIEVAWNDENVYNQGVYEGNGKDHRVLYGSSDNTKITITPVRITNGPATFNISNLGAVEADTVILQFKYDMEHDGYFGGCREDKDNTKLTEQQRNVAWQKWNTLNTHFANFNPQIKIPAGAQSLEGSQYEETEFTAELTIEASKDWQKRLKIGGTDSSHEGYDYPAMDDSTLKYRYYVVENDTEGYAVTYTNNNGIETGVITVYNRKTTADLNIVKVDKGTPTVRLKGAEFELFKLDVTQNGAETASDWTEEHKVKTDDNGEASFKGLVPGEYYRIQETGVPKGYILTGDSNVYIKVTTEGIQRIAFDAEKTPDQWSVTGDDGMISLSASTLTVKNESGVALPSTGGPGTTLIYTFGSLLTLAALALLIRRRAEQLQRD